MGLNIIVFILIIISFALIFNIRLSDIKTFFILNNIGKARYSQKEIIYNHNKQKKENSFIRLIRDRKKNLEIMGKEKIFEKILILSFVLGFLGICISILTYNIFLAPAIFLLLFFLPFLGLVIYENSFTKLLIDELEASMSLITNTYLRTANIYDAIAENISHINMPVKKIYSQFLYEVKYVNPDIKKALLRLKNSYQNEIFNEWIDTLLLCQEDKTNRVLLEPIVHKLSDIKSINLNLDLRFYEPLKDFITMAILILLNIPMMKFLNKEWFQIYTGTIIGKIIISLSIFIIFLGLFSLVKILKPIGGANEDV